MTDYLAVHAWQELPSTFQSEASVITNDTSSVVVGRMSGSSVKGWRKTA